MNLPVAGGEVSIMLPNRGCCAVRPLVLTLLALSGFMGATLAQEVSIPDPGLNAAIREALQQPIGPLTHL